jgi:hypothetical protein
MVQPSSPASDDGSGFALLEMAIDTLKVAKRLREAGFPEPQAEAVIAAVQEGTEAADLATKVQSQDREGARP